MVLKGPFLNGTRLPVDQILLLGCWYLSITLNPRLLLEWIFCKKFVNAVVKLKHLDYNSECPRIVC
jgi:hypothetical protein